MKRIDRPGVFDINLVFVAVVCGVILFFCWRILFLVERIRFDGLLSDGTFKVSSIEKPGWTHIDFDDRTWKSARSPYWEGYEIPWLHDIKLPGIAFPIWGRRGTTTVYFRKTFILNRLPDSPVSLSILVDDDYDLYLNGVLIARNKDHRTTFPGETYRVESRLKKGKNVLSVKGINNALAAHMILIMPLKGTGLETSREWRPLVYSILIVVVLMSVLVLYFRKSLKPAVPLRTPLRLIYIVPPAWGAWILFFRRHPVYEMNPTVVMTPFHKNMTMFCLLSGCALAYVTFRILFNGNVGRASSKHIRFVSFLSVYIVILGIGIFLRFYRYAEIPPGIFQDDASFMLEGHRLISDGTWTVWIDDMNGNGTLMVYWDGFFSHLVGRNLLSLRSAPAVIGILTLIIVPVLIRKLFSDIPALLTAFFMSVSHFHINYSRIPWDQITVPLLSAVSFLSLFQAIQTRRLSWAVLSGGACALGVYGYAGFRVVPLIVFTVPFAFHWSIRSIIPSRLFRTAALTFVLMIIPLVIYGLGHPGALLKRMHLVDIFPTFLQYKDPVPVAIQSLKTILMSVFIGDGVTPRHNTPGCPALDITSGVFFLIGIVVLTRKDLWHQMVEECSFNFSTADLFRSGLLGWLFLGTILSSVTFEAPHFSRSINLLFPFLFIASLGAWIFLRQVPCGRRFRILLVLLMCICTISSNIRIYFGEKLKDKRVYDHCGYPALVVNRRIDALEEERKHPDIRFSPRLWYTVNNAVKWLHPEVASRSNIVVAGKTQLTKLNSKSLTGPIYFYVAPEDRYVFSMDGVSRHRVFRNPLGKPMFEEWEFSGPAYGQE